MTVDADRLREAITYMRREIDAISGRCDASVFRSIDRWGLILDAASSTLPKTKMVEVGGWLVLGDQNQWFFECEAAARRHASRRDGTTYPVIRVSGHAEVPT